MNAPTAVRHEVKTFGCPHRAAISIHCPNESDLSMIARVSIASLRDQASAGMRRCSEASRPILQTITQLASEAVYARMPEGKLCLIAGALGTLMNAARNVERAVNWSERGDG